MSMHFYMAHELARSRQEELRRQAMRRPRRMSGRSDKLSLRRLRFWSLKVPAPRSAPAR